MHYLVTLNPVAHQFTVTFATPARGQRLSLPAWIPGSYMVRDFSKSIVRFAVADEAGGEVQAEALDKHTWRLPNTGAVLTVSIVVYANDTSVRAAYLDHRGGFFNGTSLFLMDETARDKACSVTLITPSEWDVAVALPLDVQLEDIQLEDIRFEQGDSGAQDASDTTHKRQRYIADDYDSLVDSPFMFGDLRRIAFSVEDANERNVPHELVLLGATEVDDARCAQDLQAICTAHVQRMGALPCPQYLFLTNVVGSGYGGLEHKDSTLLEVERRSLPFGPTTDAYTEFLGLCSHEYFHLWNVKRIRPAGLVPLDYSRENYTKLLWLFEGVTSYLDDYTLLTSGVIDRAAYFQLLGSMMSRVLNAPGNTQRSLEASSFYTWTQFYQQNENAPNAVTNYYSRGAMVALALDLLLRTASAGVVNMSVLMRRMWEKYGATAVPVPEGGEGNEGRGGEDNGLLQTCLELLPEAANELRPFFNRYVLGNDLPDLEALLRPFGVKFATTAASEVFAKTLQATEAAVGLGARYVADAQAVTLKVVMNGGPAEQAGLMPGDKIIAIDGLQATASSLQWRLAAASVGDVWQLHVFRGDRLMNVALTLSAPWMQLCSFEADTLTNLGEAWLC